MFCVYLLFPPCLPSLHSADFFLCRVCMSYLGLQSKYTNQKQTNLIRGAMVFQNLNTIQSCYIGATTRYSTDYYNSQHCIDIYLIIYFYVVPLDFMLRINKEKVFCFLTSIVLLCMFTYINLHNS